MTRLAALLPLLLAVGCGFQPPVPERDELPQDVKSFPALYARNCAACHGADGKLGPAPPLNDPLFLALIPRSEVVRVLREGRPGTPMPSFTGWKSDAAVEPVHLGRDGKVTDQQVGVVQVHVDRGGTLTDEQIELVADDLTKHWKAGDAKGAPPYLADKPGNAEAGKKVYALSCSGCHGGLGEGGSLGDKRVGALRSPAFLALISDQALRRIVITGRPDLGMPDYAGKREWNDKWKPLTSQEVSDVVALLASWRTPTLAGN